MEVSLCNRIIFLIVILGSLYSLGLSQNKQDYHWVMGYNGQNPHPDLGGTNFIFNNDSLRLSSENRSANFFTSNISISNSDSGNLLIYSNGCSIFGANNNIISNGDSINFGDLWQTFCPRSGLIPAMGSGIIEIPSKDSSLFIILHQKVSNNPRPGILLAVTNLLETRIVFDVVKNQWEVISKNISVIQDLLHASHISSIKELNSSSYYFIQPQRFGNKYYILKVDSIGNITQKTISLSHKLTGPRGDGGQSSFSPNGKLYARFDLVEDGFFLMDFDRSTGELSNVRNIPISDEIDISGGLCFSPNSRFLYITAASVIYQFDLEANDIAVSKTVVAEYDGFLDPFPTNFFLCNLGPDCKIYINSTNGVKSMHVIRYPDRKGLACGVAQHAIKLPTYNAASMPNFPHYRVDEDWPCDSTIGVKLSTSTYIPSQKVEFEVYPNPASHVLNLEYDLRGIKELTFDVFNIHGELILTSQVTYQHFRQELDISSWPSGVYSWRLYNDEGAFTNGKVVKE